MYATVPDQMAQMTSRLRSSVWTCAQLATSRMARIHFLRLLILGLFLWQVIKITLYALLATLNYNSLPSAQTAACVFRGVRLCIRIQVRILDGDSVWSVGRTLVGLTEVIIGIDTGLQQCAFANCINWLSDPWN